MSSVPDPLNVQQINANEIKTNSLYADQVSGQNGGATISAKKINLGGWILESEDDGIYVTTPSGIKTKMELIDFREVPIPPTAKLILPPSNTIPLNPMVVPGGPSGPGGQPGNGNFNGGGGASGSSSSGPGSPYTGASAANNIMPGGDGAGYQAITPAALAKLPVPYQTDTQFLGCLDSLAQKKNVPVDSLLTVMNIESGHGSTTIDSTAENQYTHAIGLNQIMPKTAENLGYSTDQIRNMTGAQQMCGPVTDYFNQVPLPASPSTADLYLANFYPAAVGQSDDYVLGNHPGMTPQILAQQNQIFKNSDGVVTVGSIKQYIANRSPI